MSKTLMVAQREFMENMRTKTFWIGVLVAPVGIVVFYAVMFLLANTADVRKYSVVDRSQSTELGEGWLSTEVFERAKAGVLEERVKEFVNEKIDKTFAEETSSRELIDSDREGFVSELVSTLVGFASDQIGVADLLKMVADSRKAATPEDLEIVAAWEQALTADMNAWSEFGEAIVQKAIELQNDGQISRDFELVDLPEDEEPLEALNRMVQSGEIFAYFVIEDDPLTEEHGSRYVSNNLTDFKLKNWFTGHATSVIRDQHIARLEREKNLSQEDLNDLRAQFKFIGKQVSDTGEEDDVETADTTRNFAPLVFVYLLWISVFIGAQMLLTNTVEEKSNRIIEVLLSSVSPSQLMHGKIYGIALTGLTVMGSWAAFLIAGIKLAPMVLPPEGASDIAELGLDAIVADPVFLVSFFVYFLSGYFFYAAVLVAIGSVCNSLKEAQNLMQPVMFALFVPLATMIPITNDPNGTVARIVTYIPLYTPFAMMNRAAGPAPVWEYFASSAVILVSLWIAFRGAAKVFRVGVLMTGKPPRIREILRWMRAPVK